MRVQTNGSGADLPGSSDTKPRFIHFSPQLAAQTQPPVAPPNIDLHPPTHPPLQLVAFIRNAFKPC